MRLDVLTLYYLLVGTSVLMVALTLWESLSAGRRHLELRLCAAAYVLFALGSSLLPAVSETPIMIGRGLSHLMIASGYAVLIAAVGALTGRRAWRWPLFGFCAAYAAVWLPLAPFLTNVTWFWISSLTIAGINLVGAVLVWRGRRIADLRARPLLAATFLVHAVVYLIRLPILLAADSAGTVRHSLAVATVFEGVLFAVAVPALFIAAIREEREKQLVAASRTDFLTGLDNRRALFQEALRLPADAPHALLLADLDHFKRVNDRYGHETGDHVLKLFARVAAAELPRGAIIARLGGEEFAAILPGTPEAVASTARRLASRFTEATRRFEALDAEITVSIGLAALISGPGCLAEALRAADAALYRAKAGGRDRVEIDAATPLPDRPLRFSRAAARPARTPWSTKAAG